MPRHADQPWAQEAPKTEISDAVSNNAFACSMVAENNFTHSPRIVDPALKGLGRLRDGRLALIGLDDNELSYASPSIV